MFWVCLFVYVHEVNFKSNDRIFMNVFNVGKDRSKEEVFKFLGKI